MALISIIIPVYNIENYLDDCIQSIINQSINDFEVILVDDGSTDTSGQLCDQYCSVDNRIKVIHQDNQGVSVARNNGIKLSKGKYILFVDGDDYISKFALETHLDVLKNTNADISISDYCVNSNQLLQIKNSILSIQSYQGSYMFEKMLSNDDTNGYLWNKMFKADIIKKNGLFFKKGIKVWEDMLFLMEYYMYSNLVSIIPDVLYYYRQRSDSAVSSLNISKELDKLKVLKLIYILPYPKTDIFYQYIENIFVSLYFKIINQKKEMSDEEIKEFMSIEKFILHSVGFKSLSYKNKILLMIAKIRKM